jgi:hypothetical protein
VETTSNAKSAYTLPALMVLPPWCATSNAQSRFTLVETTLSANSAYTLPARMVLPPWCATAQATQSVRSVLALPATVLVLQ